MIELELPAGGLSATTRSSRATRAVAPFAGQVHRVYRSLPYASVEVPASALEKLRQSPEVKNVYPIVSLELSLDGSMGVVWTGDAGERSALTGAGQAVAVVDTGVRSDHPFFAGPDGSRVVAEACFSSTEDCPNGQRDQIVPGAGEPLVFRGSEEPHGTHVAGIAAGSRQSTDPARGVASESDLVSVQIFGDTGASTPRTNSADLAYALDWLHEVHDDYNIAVVNLSLGGGAHAADCDDVAAYQPVRAAVDQLRDVGVVTVAASGNGGLRDGMSWPACLSSVVSVGATTNADAFSWFTNVSKATDVMAPGSGIRSSVPDGGYRSFNGTSMAAPHVAGAVGLLREVAPGSSWEEVRGALRTSDTSVDDLRSDGVHADLPRLDIHAALDVMEGAAPGPDAPDPIEDPSYVPLTPSRVLDTRSGAGSVKRPVGHRESRSVKVTGVGGVPSSGVGAVVMNVTAVDATRSSFVTVWPRGVSRPFAATLNPRPGANWSNEVVAKVGSNGRVNVYNHNGEVDLVFDVVGYLPG